MPRLSLLRFALSAFLVAGGLAAVPASAAPAKPGDDAVVIAVIDSGFSPYHWDYLAAKMPQAKTRSKADDLPLTKAPHTWLAGFPKPSSFTTYQPLKLSLDAKNAKANQATLFDRDEDRWLDVEQSNREELSYYWIPGSKVIGAVSFGGSGGKDYKGPIYGTGVGEHGMGTASVSVGNINGTCPECLLVFIQAGNYEAAIEWAERQPWIDAISNSYGISTTGVARDRVYAGSDTALQQRATQRGQTIFFSAGNGVVNDFITPNGTLLSSQEGPDWIVTVGATEPANVDYSGSGKPADVAGIGGQYPSAYGGKTVTGKGDFGGTSNATPTIAGTYGRALWLARQQLAGKSRIQKGGVVAAGKPFRCGSARRNCELADGKLTRRELQTRLFQGATPTPGGYAGRRTVPRSVLGLVEVPEPVGGESVPFVTTPPVADERRLSEGYGTYRARLDGTKKWLAEFNTRVWDVMTGKRKAPSRPAGDVEWFRVDSWCRQHIWGAWEEGTYQSDNTTPLPAPDPATPARNAYHSGCQGLTKPPPPPAG
ncbi:MAG TPA: S8/S53 family peptidase [Frankiaceae bacterium]|nr:S8/S53 family peptidase [Frankiaceae bacterium]